MHQSKHPVFDTYRFHLFITDYHFELIKLEMSSIYFCHAFKVQVSDISNINSNSIKFTQPSF